MRTIVEQLQCEMYYVALLKKKNMLKRFLNNRNRTMMIINAFELRLDVSNIQLIVHVNSFEILMKYAQKSDREKRDDSICRAIIVRNNAHDQSRVNF